MHWNYLWFSALNAYKRVTLIELIINQTVEITFLILKMKEQKDIKVYTKGNFLIQWYEHNTIKYRVADHFTRIRF